jgi:predicted alternative tryptophan synthase beta-subunit
LLLLLQVWQVRASYDAKPYRKTIMQTWCAFMLIY